MHQGAGCSVLTEHARSAGRTGRPCRCDMNQRSRATYVSQLDLAQWPVFRINWGAFHSVERRIGAVDDLTDGQISIAQMPRCTV